MRLLLEESWLALATWGETALEACFLLSGNNTMLMIAPSLHVLGKIIGRS